MSGGLAIGSMLGTTRLVRSALDEAAAQLNIAKVLAAIAGLPMPDPGCACTTCRYRWTLIRRFLPKTSHQPKDQDAYTLNPHPKGQTP